MAFAILLSRYVSQHRTVKVTERLTLINNNSSDPMSPKKEDICQPYRYIPSNEAHPQMQAASGKITSVTGPAAGRGPQSLTCPQCTRRSAGSDKIMRMF